MPGRRKSGPRHDPVAVERRFTRLVSATANAVKEELLEAVDKIRQRPFAKILEAKDILSSKGTPSVVEAAKAQGVLRSNCKGEKRKDGPVQALRPDEAVWFGSLVAIDRGKSLTELMEVAL